jgi:hypothetical protein
MKQTGRKKLFQQAAEAEGGMSISAGARLTHVRGAVETGRGFYVDLSGIPEEARPSVIAEIRAVIDRASTTTSSREDSGAPSAR